MDDGLDPDDAADRERWKGLQAYSIEDVERWEDLKKSKDETRNTGFAGNYRKRREKAEDKDPKSFHLNSSHSSSPFF